MGRMHLVQVPGFGRVRNSWSRIARLALCCSWVALTSVPGVAEDRIRDLQTAAIKANRAKWAHWGTATSDYSQWRKHSNRLIPVYTFGLNLDKYQGENSIYRDEAKLKELYGRVPEATVNPEAEYLDQTDVSRLQQDAVASGKKYVFLVVMDGMDWQTTWAASIYKTNRIPYTTGRGTGLAFQDYRGVDTDYGFMVTSPHNDGTKVDMAGQVVLTPGGLMAGGYDPASGGNAPWDQPADPDYLISKGQRVKHAVTDSAASATSMTTGIKTYNDAINVDFEGKQVETLAHKLQADGWGVGVVTSVPISHATPACAYAHNVSRDDYHNICRDLVGQPSASHRRSPLPGMDVVIGAGWDVLPEGTPQGHLISMENKYVPADLIPGADVAQGGKYEIAVRTEDVSGSKVLSDAAFRAAKSGNRLLGIFGTTYGHLPFRTADGHFDPTDDVMAAEKYSAADVQANPAVADMTKAALTVLERKKQFWLMVEGGDVDWANHADNIDNSIGAVLSADDAVKVIFDWIEARDAWSDSAVIVTADHGHYLQLDQPEALVDSASK